MILCYYIETKDDSIHSKLLIEVALKESAQDFFNCTEYDPYTSGFCKVDSMDAIRRDLVDNIKFGFEHETTQNDSD